MNDATPPTILVLVMLSIMGAKILSPLAVPTSGKLLLQVQVPLLFRVLDQRVNILSILSVLILGSGLFGERWISHGLFLFAIIVMIGLVSLPRRYEFTSQGVSPHRSAFRPWSDFKGWEAKGNVLALQSGGRVGSLRLYLTGKEREEAVALVQRFIPNHVTPQRAS